MLFFTSGLGTLALGVAHFWLPHQYQWGQALSHEPMLAWGVLMLNFAMSSAFVIVGCAIMVVAAAALRVVAIDIVLFIVGLFWVANASYQIIYPPPGWTATGRVMMLAPALLNAACCSVPFARRVLQTRNQSTFDS